MDRVILRASCPLPTTKIWGHYAFPFLLDVKIAYMLKHLNTLIIKLKK